MPELKFDEYHDAPEAAEPEPLSRTEPLLILPIFDAVMFPNTNVGFTLRDNERVERLQEALSNAEDVFVVPLEEGEDASARLGATVTRARVLRIKPQAHGAVVFLEGTQRVTLALLQGDGVTQKGVGEVVVETSPPSNDEYWQAAQRNLRDSAIEMAKHTPGVPVEVEEVLRALSDPAVLTDMLSGNMDLPFDDKRMLLDTANLVTRVDRLQSHLNSQLHIVSLQEKLRDDVQTEFTDAQRRAYLREQLRAIQKELGEDDSADESLDQLREKLDAAGLPKEVQTQVDKDMARVQRLPPASPDYATTLDYLETVADLPWSKLSNEDIDLDEAEAILDADHHGLDKVKRRLLEYLAVRKLNPNGRGPILCLVGPPGVGKTSLGKSVARALGRQFVRIALGGVRDEAEIRGHRKTYVGAMLGRVLQEIRRAGTRNPVVMLDEIDKMGADFRGDPASALLEVLDPAQNNSFVDHYLNMPFDLSQVVFITTANQLDTIPAPLRDRMEIVRLSGYTPIEKRTIAQRYLVPRQAEQNGIVDQEVTWTEPAVDQLIRNYTREAGVRLLEQKVGAVTRAIAAKVARDDTGPFTVDADLVEDALGPAEVVDQPHALDDRVGIVHGLAYTPVGGDVLPIEAVRYPGKGRLQLTGQLGSVMQESAQAAQSVVKSRAEALGIQVAFDEYDVHLHVPAGAIPKDGPSAGAAMFLALASLYTQRKVRGDVAMTGEINLRGEVLPIGGLPEKTLAALANGIHKVLIPAGNQKDIPTLPPEVRDAVELVPVSTVEDVIAAALLDEPAAS